MGDTRRETHKEDKDQAGITPSDSAVKDFFAEWETYTKGKWFLSAWKDKSKRKATDSLTCEDIIWHAMKSPPDTKGNGGNRTAQILFRKYHINVGLEQKSPTECFPGTTLSESMS